MSLLIITFSKHDLVYDYQYFTIHASRISIQHKIKLNWHKPVVCIYLDLNLILNPKLLWRNSIHYDESRFTLMNLVSFYWIITLSLRCNLFCQLCTAYHFSFAIWFMTRILNYFEVCYVCHMFLLKNVIFFTWNLIW